MEGNEEKPKTENSTEEAPSANITKTEEKPIEAKQTSNNQKTTPNFLNEEPAHPTTQATQNHPITKIIKKQNEPKIVRNVVIQKNTNENSNSNTAQVQVHTSQSQSQPTTNSHPNSISFLTNDVDKPQQIPKKTVIQATQQAPGSVSTLLQTPTNEPKVPYIQPQTIQIQKQQQPTTIKVVKINQDNKPKVIKAHPQQNQVSSPSSAPAPPTTSNSNKTSGFSLDAMINPTPAQPPTTQKVAITKTMTIKQTPTTVTTTLAPHIITQATTIPQQTILPQQVKIIHTQVQAPTMQPIHIQQVTQPPATHQQIKIPQRVVQIQQIPQHFKTQQLTLHQQSFQQQQQALQISQQQHVQVAKGINPLQPTLIPRYTQQIGQANTSNPIVYRTITQTSQTIQPIHIKPPEPVKESAAPFPLLPQAQEIQKYIRELSTQISEAKAELRELESELEYGMLSVPPISDATVECQILDFHNNIYPKGERNTIIECNKKHIQNSHNKYKLPDNKEKSRQTYKHIIQLPYFMQELEQNEPILETVLHTLTQRKVQNELKGRRLAEEYRDRRELWAESNHYLESYHEEIHEAIDSWPPEFAKSQVKPNDKSLIQYCARDKLMEMYLDPMEQEGYLFYNENGFVEDPVAEHESFKRRTSWTDQEKHIFYEKYSQHPKEFKKIAAALPTKSIKDVIEFYFINRRKLNLKIVDTQQKKRGGRKRIITEGGY